MNRRIKAELGQMKSQSGLDCLHCIKQRKASDVAPHHTTLPASHSILGLRLVDPPSRLWQLSEKVCEMTGIVSCGIQLALSQTLSLSARKEASEA